MFASAKSWFAPKANPIGVDFGADSLKMAQTRWDNKEPHLIAAGAAEVPSHLHSNPAGRLAFFTESVRDLLAHNNFRGRTAVLALPASVTYVQHLRLDKMDDAALVKALPGELRGKLPFDPAHAILRHHVAGEIYQDSEPQHEVIVMAAAREWVNQFLEAAAKAHLDVVGLHVEPTTIVGCFGRIYRRQSDAAVVNCFIDIGMTSTRAIIAQGPQLLFARSIGIGGEHLNRAVASALKITLDEARLLRRRFAQTQPEALEHRDRASLDPAAMAVQSAGNSPARDDDRSAVLAATHRVRRQAGGDDEFHGSVAVAEGPGSGHYAADNNGDAAPLSDDLRLRQRAVEDASHNAVQQLIGELELCRRYHETTFPSKPVDRLIFLGGEARQRALCQSIAKGLDLAAQIGDPLVRMSRTTDVGPESGLDRRQPQPAWAVALGLSLGLDPVP